ncbi:MAG TPA: cupin domain-containing protein [Tahibacter sp.]|nr:cupin domain-containing protein [Tahibacter sp.]
MNPTMLSLFIASMTPASGADAPSIVRAGERESLQGPEANFTGRVRVEPLYAGNATINTSGAYVTFEPGARSAWHTHPAGQYLVVTAGVGRTQVEGGPVQELRPGDVVWCPPGIKHWHGAAPDSAMTHLAVTGMRDGKNVEWLGKVGDDEYAGR